MRGKTRNKTRTQRSESLVMREQWSSDYRDRLGKDTGKPWEDNLPLKEVFINIYSFKKKKMKELSKQKHKNTKTNKTCFVFFER